MTTKTTRASDEFRRVQTLFSGLTTSVPIALMDLDKIAGLESAAATSRVNGGILQRTEEISESHTPTRGSRCDGAGIRDVYRGRSV